MDFQSEKSFGKLRLRAFQPYHQILCILKHVGDVGDNQVHLRAVMLSMSKMSKIDQIHLRAVMLCMSKMSKMEKNIQIHVGS